MHTYQIPAKGFLRHKTPDAGQKRSIITSGLAVRYYKFQAEFIFQIVHMYYCSALPLYAFYPHVKTVLCSCKICLGDQMSSSGLLCSGRLHSEVILLTFLPSSMFQEVFLSPFFPQMQKEVGQSHNIFLKSKNCQWVATKICNLQTDSSFELG